jgi:uncharacterized membrane protein
VPSGRGSAPSCVNASGRKCAKDREPGTVRCREAPCHDRARRERRFSDLCGILFGLGLGGFFDGIVLHQILQWHHMLTSAGYPPDSIENLKVNTFWDGVFHAATYVFTALGLYILWRHSRRSHIRWSGRLLPRALLLGFGLFNAVEGLVDHQLLASITSTRPFLASSGSIGTSLS